MEADLTPQQQPPVDTSAPTEPAPEPPPVASALAETLNAFVGSSSIADQTKLAAAIAVISHHEQLALKAARTEVDADVAFADAFLEAQGAEGARKATATAKTSEQRHKAEQARVRAQAAGRLVDLLVGPAVIQR